MPLSLDPNQTFRYVLATDRAKAPADQPYLVLRFLSARDWHKMGSALGFSPPQGTSVDDSNCQTIAAWSDAIRTAMVGWGNMGRDYDPAVLEDVLSVGELRDVLSEALNEMTVAAADLKKSVRRSRAGTAASASAAAGPAPGSPAKAGAVASVPTPPDPASTSNAQVATATVADPAGTGAPGSSVHVPPGT